MLEEGNEKKKRKKKGCSDEGTIPDWDLKIRPEVPCPCRARILMVNVWCMDLRNTVQRL